MYVYRMGQFLALALACTNFHIVSSASENRNDDKLQLNDVLPQQGDAILENTHGEHTKLSKDHGPASPTSESLVPLLHRVTFASDNRGDNHLAALLAISPAEPTTSDTMARSRVQDMTGADIHATTHLDLAAQLLEPRAQSDPAAHQDPATILDPRGQLEPTEQLDPGISAENLPTSLSPIKPEFASAHLQSIFNSIEDSYCSVLPDIRYFVSLSHILIPLITDTVKAVTGMMSQGNGDNLELFVSCRRLLFLESYIKSHITIEYDKIVAAADDLLRTAVFVPASKSLGIESVFRKYGGNTKYVIMAMSAIHYLDGIDLPDLRKFLVAQFDKLRESTDAFSRCAVIYEKASSRRKENLNKDAKYLLSGIMDVSDHAVNFANNVQRGVSWWSADDLLAQKYNELSQRTLSSLPPVNGMINERMQIVLSTFAETMASLARTVDRYTHRMQKTLRDCQEIVRDAKRFGLSALHCEVLLTREIRLPFEITFQLRHHVMEMRTRLPASPEQLPRTVARPSRLLAAPKLPSSRTMLSKPFEDSDSYSEDYMF